MNVTYVHGYGSHFDLDNPKVTALTRLGPISGPYLNYQRDTAARNVQVVVDRCIDAKTDLVVGTSMGGWIAAEVGASVRCV